MNKYHLQFGMWVFWDDYGFLHIRDEYGAELELTPLQSRKLVEFLTRNR